MLPVVPKADVFIDTSVLRGTGWKGAPFQSLLELSKAGLLDIHIPELVFEERRTQWRDKHIEALRHCAAALQALTSDDIYPSGHLPAANKALEALSKVDLDAASKEAFEKLFKQNNIKIVPLSISQAKTAWDLYFGGAAPLKKSKNRDDIPDAHIFAAASEVAQSKLELHCVCSDGPLSAALEGLDSVFVHASIEELLKADIIARVRTHWEADKVWQQVQSNVSYQDLKDEVVSFLEHVAGDCLMGERLLSSMIPDAGSNARVEWADGGELVEVENPDDWGGGLLSFDVSFECDAGASFLVDPDDASKLPHWIRVTWGDPFRRSLGEGEATLRLYVEGFVTAQVDLERAKRNETPLLTNLSVSISDKTIQDTH